MKDNVLLRSPYRDPEIPSVSIFDFVLGSERAEDEMTALIDASTGEIFSYRRLREQVGRLAAGLRTRGLRKGDVFAICTPNSPEWVVTCFAVLAAGGVVTTVSAQATERELAFQLQHSKARFLLAGRVLAHSPAAANLEAVFVAGEGQMDSLMVDSDRSFDCRVDADDPAVILYSSGTTGLPKGVLISHRGLVAALCQIRDLELLTSKDVVLAALPLSHYVGLQIILNHALACGATVVTMPRFDFEDFLRDIERHRVTRIAVAPPIVLALAKDPAVNEHDLSSLKMIACGAAPLSRDVALECARRVGCRVKQMYGLTEAGPVTFSPDGGAARPESIGPLSPGVVARIVDPKTGRDVRAGAAGELWVRAPARMLGYLDNSEATAAMIDAQGWLHTGDVVYADTNGWLHVTDRIKELIKYKGHQVAPAELEAILLSHPAVADAAVVASSDEAAGEVPKAFVAIRSPVSAADLMEFVASQVSPYKRIRRLEFIERIPKSPSGKILRRLLMELEQGQTAVQAA